MTQPYVLSFVGENANGILQWWTEQIHLAFQLHGLAQQIINLCEPGWHPRLDACLAQGKPEFCFSFQGMGCDLRLKNGDNFWSRNRIPFISYLGDNPYLAPGLHAAEGPGIYFLYGCADLLQVYRDFLRGQTYATTIRFGYPDNPHANTVRWQDRKHPVVFVKTGVDARAMRGEWKTLPAAVRAILEDAVAVVLTGADETIATICARVFADHKMHRGVRNELFLSTCSMVDRYVRAVWAERMVCALMKHDALIVGDWSHLDHSNARADFCGPRAAVALEELYADTQILVNTKAGVRFGMHERVMAGFLAKSAVVSDSTPFMQKTLKDCPAFFGVDIDAQTFADELDYALTSCLGDPASAERVEASHAVARELFSFDKFIQQLLDFVELEKYRQVVEIWSFPRPAFQP